MKIFWGSLILCFFMLAGCSSNNGGIYGNTDGSGGGQSNSPPIVGDLIGTWTKPCVSAGSQGGFIKSTITNADRLTSMLSQTFQSSSTCTGVADLESRANFSYVVSQYTPGQINSIDMTVNSVRARFNTLAGVTLANTTSFCGFNDWQINIERDVAGRNCIVGIPAVGQPYYDIFKIDGNNLFTGQVDASHSGQNPASRPTELDRTPYSK